MFDLYLAPHFIKTEINFSVVIKFALIYNIRSRQSIPSAIFSISKSDLL